MSRKQKKQVARKVPQYRDRSTQLFCSTCKTIVVITSSGLVCECPGVWPDLKGYAKKFNRQVSVCEADRMTGKLIRALARVEE